MAREHERAERVDVAWAEDLGRQVKGVKPRFSDQYIAAKIEELIQALKTQYTIVIVTHNMQQAGRISDFTAFFYLGRLIEFGLTAKIFSNPSERQTEDYITGRFG